MIRYRRMLLLPLDAALVALSYILAYLVRFEGHLPQEQWLPFWLGLSLSLAIKPLCFVVGGFYRRLWRYASIPDLLHIIKTVSISCLIALISIVFLSHFSGFSRSIPILDWVFLNVLILARSLAWRVVREERLRRRSQAGRQ